MSQKRGSKGGIIRKIFDFVKLQDISNFESQMTEKSSDVGYTHALIMYMYVFATYTIQSNQWTL